MKTISPQLTEIKGEGEGAGQREGVSISCKSAQHQPCITSRFDQMLLFYYYNYNLHGVEEMVGDSS